LRSTPTRPRSRTCAPHRELQQPDGQCGGGLQVFTQEFKKVEKADNASIFKMFQREKMLVPSGNKVSFSFYGTFEDTIIRFISQKMEVGMTTAEIRIFVSKTTFKLSGPRIRFFLRLSPSGRHSSWPVLPLVAAGHRIPAPKFGFYRAGTCPEIIDSYFSLLVGQPFHRSRRFPAAKKSSWPRVFLSCVHPSPLAAGLSSMILFRQLTEPYPSLGHHCKMPCPFRATF